MQRLCFIIFLYSFQLSSAEWTGFNGCGKYSFKGVVRVQKDHRMILVINEKTNSEIIFNTSYKGQIQLASYQDRAVSGEINVVNKMDGPLGEMEVVKIEERIPNPLLPHDTELKFLSSEKCTK